MKRTRPPARKTPMKRTPMKQNGAPKRSAGKRHRKPNRSRVQDPARWQAVPMTRCVACEAEWPLQRHHVVFAQHVDDHQGDASDPDNQVVLCELCHASLHRTRAFDSRMLPDAAINFALRLLGVGPAYEYLSRYYATSRDERVQWLLKRWETDR